jgi:hypothetical protein
LILPSEEQKEEDKENPIRELLKTVNLNDDKKLNEIWGEVNETKEESLINIALTHMEEYLGNSYLWGGGDRTSLDEKGTNEMDCSEFVCRYLQKLGAFTDVPSIRTVNLRNPENFAKTEYGKKLQFISKSDNLNFIPQIGDVFVWSRSEDDGHTGVVVGYDSENDYVLIMEAIGCKEPCSNDTDLNPDRGCCKVVKSTYKRTGKSLQAHSGWIGYYRPVI